ncbi:retrovirus-related pol polyprotein from transposon TNT 1-94 [Tanacetum coccineum]
MMQNRAWRRRRRLQATPSQRRRDLSSDGLGNATISRVYYVEGLGYNLFSVGQFCDSDLEVAFRKHTCYVRNLDGADLLSGSRDTNLYTISLDDMLKSSPISLLYLWAEAVSTACYTQNRSLIRLRYNKTPYELIHEKKPDLSFLYVFGSLCYSTDDSEDLGKLKPKADIVPVAATPRPVDPTGSPMSTSIDQDAPSTSNPSSQEQEQSLILFQGVEESLKTPHFHDDPLYETLHKDSNLQGSSLNVRPSYNLLDLHCKWTKNHPLSNVIGDPSRSVSIRKQLKTDAMWCYFDAFLTSVELNNFKEAMLKL